MSLFGEITATGWIADGPTGREEAILLLAPTRTGAVDPTPAMHELIASLGLTPNQVRPHTGLDAVLVGDHVTVRLPTGAILAERPTSPAWARIARQAAQIVLVIGTAPLTGDVDDYTSTHGHTCALTLLPLAKP